MGHAAQGWEGVAGDLSLRVTGIWIVFRTRHQREKGGSSRSEQTWRGEEDLQGAAARTWSIRRGWKGRRDHPTPWVYLPFAVTIGIQE